jgi:hypothetical protein
VGVLVVVLVVGDKLRPDRPLSSTASAAAISCCAKLSPDSDSVANDILCKERLCASKLELVIIVAGADPLAAPAAAAATAATSPSDKLAPDTDSVVARLCIEML